MNIKQSTLSQEEILTLLTSSEYKQSRAFAESQFFLGAKLVCLEVQKDTVEHFIALRYPIGPLRKIVCMHSPKLTHDELQHIIKKLALHDVIIEIPVQLMQESKHFEYDFIVELTGHVDDAHKQLEKRSQRAIRQAQDNGLTVQTFTKETMTGQALNDFYRVYVDRMKRFRSPTVPKAYIEFLISRGSCVLQNVYHNGKVIAGATLIVHNNEVINELIASSEEALQLRPNNFLVWHFILYALEKKLQRVNLGPSPLESPVALFKQSMGGKPVAQYVVIERYPKLLKLARKLR